MIISVIALNLVMLRYYRKVMYILTYIVIYQLLVLLVAKHEAIYQLMVLNIMYVGHTHTMKPFTYVLLGVDYYIEST